MSQLALFLPTEQSRRSVDLGPHGPSSPSEQFAYLSLLSVVLERPVTDVLSEISEHRSADTEVAAA